MTRPYPPAALLDAVPIGFAPALELEQWARQQFINELSPINNPDHEHLQSAEIGFLWTNAPNARQGRVIAGTCQMMPFNIPSKWAKAMLTHQLGEWFGDRELHFLITISAPIAAAFDDASFMALIEHELYHAGYEDDGFGSPKFTRDGDMKFAMRAHDVEEFVGVVRRYGAGAAGVDQMVQAANKGPEIAEGLISRACGSCLRLVKG